MSGVMFCYGIVIIICLFHTRSVPGGREILMQEGGSRFIWSYREADSCDDIEYGKRETVMGGGKESRRGSEKGWRESVAFIGVPFYVKFDAFISGGRIFRKSMKLSVFDALRKRMSLCVWVHVSMSLTVCEWVNSDEEIDNFEQM